MHHDDDVETLLHSIPVQAHVFTKAPLYPAARYGTTDSARNGEAQAQPRSGPMVDEKTQALRGNLPATSDRGLKLPRRAKAIRPRKALPHLRHPSRHHTVRRFRPLARRRLNVRRPPFVRIRLRNPWVRFRLVRLGWYVRFTRYLPPGGADKTNA